MNDPIPGNAPTPTFPPFTRTVRLGSILTHGGARVSVYAQIRWDGARLSISGVEGPQSNGNAYGSCGQIIMSYRTAEERAKIKPAPGWAAESIGRFFDLWGRWHLNDMRAGSPAQRERLAGLTFPGYPASHYEWACAELSAAGLHPDPGYLHNGEPYAYGSAWLAEDVPADVLAELAAFPEADRSPAWV